MASLFSLFDTKPPTFRTSITYCSKNVCLFFRIWKGFHNRTRNEALRLAQSWHLFVHCNTALPFPVSLSCLFLFLYSCAVSKCSFFSYLKEGMNCYFFLFSLPLTSDKNWLGFVETCLLRIFGLLLNAVTNTVFLILCTSASCCVYNKICDNKYSKPLSQNCHWNSLDGATGHEAIYLQCFRVPTPNLVCMLATF